MINDMAENDQYGQDRIWSTAENGTCRTLINYKIHDGFWSTSNFNHDRKWSTSKIIDYPLKPNYNLTKPYHNLTKPYHNLTIT